MLTNALLMNSTVTILVVIFFILSSVRTYSLDYNRNLFVKQYTRNITIKQGVLKGIVVSPKTNRRLPPVEQYLGIPYAMPPVGELRFMPPGSAPSWTEVKYADSFGPVCPQTFPDVRKMAPQRKETFLKMQQFLENESEDCLYLNVYAPYQEADPLSRRRYPVMVFIHGESFEWNSGNTYDGSVLAAYSNVTVVTVNYRLGILGFLKADTEEYSRSNFGLVDQIAALLWVKENIAEFGGDPDTITVFGHGTGAVCASLLMLSPMVLQGSQTLFQRAILMGGTALSDWALAGNPRDVTLQVAQEVNCQIKEDLATCLRRKRLDEIMSAVAITPAYRTRFGPVVDSLVVPNDPQKSMTTYHDIFKRFEVLYGVTELESINLLGPVELTHGLLEKERDQELRKYLRSRCEMKPELCVARTLAEYGKEGSKSTLQDEYVGYTGHEPDRASLARDALLDILSDARTVAPVVQMAKYHSALNLQSYFYVFTHKTSSREYVRNMSFTGEELPYIFGVPLDGPSFHFTDTYNEKEKLLSEVIMTYFTNFATTGNPNVPRRLEYFSLSPSDWIKFDVDWMEYDSKKERYLQLDTPPQMKSHYRRQKIQYWNEIFPELATNQTQLPFIDIYHIKTTRKPSRFPPPWILHPPYYTTTVSPFNKFENFEKPYRTTEAPIYGTVILEGKDEPDNIKHRIEIGTVINSTSDPKGATMNILIVVGGIFLMINLFLFAVLYYKCYRFKRVDIPESKPEISTETAEDANDKNKAEQAIMENGCNLIKMIKSSKSDDTYEAIKSPRANSKYKLKREMSSSTIDAHTKVRDWIAHEIVYKYSPRFLRRPRQTTLDVKFSTTRNNDDEVLPLDISKNEENSTLGRSPTRPVSPSDDTRRPPLIKSSTLQHTKVKKPEKVSVAIDATPANRTPSILAQQPIELTKSLDRPDFGNNEIPLRRSVTLDDFSSKTLDAIDDIKESVTFLNLKLKRQDSITPLRVQHSHSRSEPVQDIYSTVKPKRLRTFDPHQDVNVTSRDDEPEPLPLTPEEALQTIKRRNFPKVLPDYPGKEALAHKRRSMPAPSLFMPIPEMSTFSQPNSPLEKTLGKNKPVPPIRTSSTLGRKPHPQPAQPICVSAPVLVEEVPSSPEPEIACNNLYVGPLIPRSTSSDNDNQISSAPIYSSLNSVRTPREQEKPKTIITTDPKQPIKKLEPKIIIKPSMTRSTSDPKNRNIPRVVAVDNQTCDNPRCEGQVGSLNRRIPQVDAGGNTQASSTDAKVEVVEKKNSSSSESSPSEESDTGTVVKVI